MNTPAQAIERRQIDDLVPYDRNPRMHPETQIEQLANSIQQWGWTVPLLIDESNNVIAGHGRLEAAKRLDMREVPCIIASGWSEEQRRAYVIADNKLSENSQWDDGAFFSELKELSDMDFDLSLVGIEDFEPIDFIPDTQPSISYSDITSADIDVARDRADESIRDAQTRQSNDGIEVMCPACAHTFRFVGS